MVLPQRWPRIPRLRRTRRVNDVLICKKGRFRCTDDLEVINEDPAMFFERRQDGVVYFRRLVRAGGSLRPLLTLALIKYQ